MAVSEAVSEARRHHLYDWARESWDEEAAETLIESMPHPAADLATKRDLTELGAELRVEMHGIRAELGDRIESLRSEMQALVQSQTRWLISAVAVIVGMVEAASRLG